MTVAQYSPRPRYQSGNLVKLAYGATVMTVKQVIEPQSCVPDRQWEYIVEYVTRGQHKRGRFKEVSLHPYK